MLQCLFRLEWAKTCCLYFHILVFHYSKTSIARWEYHRLLLCGELLFRFCCHMNAIGSSVCIAIQQ